MKSTMYFNIAGKLDGNLLPTWCCLPVSVIYLYIYLYMMLSTYTCVQSIRLSQQVIRTSETAVLFATGPLETVLPVSSTFQWLLILSNDTNKDINSSNKNAYKADIDRKLTAEWWIGLAISGCGDSCSGNRRTLGVCMYQGEFWDCVCRKDLCQ